MVRLAKADDHSPAAPAYEELAEEVVARAPAMEARVRPQ
jgi:hypothetical protein